MHKVTVDELMTLTAYESVRPAFRAQMIAHKKPRRVLLGPEMSLVFEDHATVVLQVQEILRAEKIRALEAIEHEVETYNDLIAPDGALLATLMIETVDPVERDRRRVELSGLDEALFLQLGDVRVAGEFDPLGRSPDKTAVVRYVTFRLPADAHARMLDRTATVSLVCTHPNYPHVAPLSEATRASLAKDLEAPHKIS